MSGEYRELKGTTKDSFKIGKQKFNIDAAAATALRQLKLPDLGIDFSGGINGDVLTKTAGGFVVQTFVPGAPSKLGTWNSTTTYAINDYVVYGNSIYISLSANLNKQPDNNPSDWSKKHGIEFGRIETAGVSLSGTIQGSLYINGNLTLITNLTVNGDLYVYGNIENNHLSNHSLTVNGSIYCSGYIDLYGDTNEEDTGYNGGDVDALGDIVAYSGIRTYGGQGDINGGHGGYISAKGSIKTTSYLQTYGGEGLDGSGGNGGNLTSLCGSISAGTGISTKGGKANGVGIYSGGNGGTITAAGNLFSGSSGISSGGGAASVNGTGVSNGGNGGSITANENIISKGAITTNGGFGWDTGQAGISNNINATKDIYCEDGISVSGSNNGKNCNVNGISGGNINATNLQVPSIMIMGGGFVGGGTGTGNGGTGGILTVTNNINIVDLFGFGGDHGGGGGNGGNGGTITCDGNIFCTKINMYAKPSTTSAGGNGGNVSAKGHIFAYVEIQVYGGQGATIGGNGGSIIATYGDIKTLTGQLKTYGGVGLNGSGGAAGNITSLGGTISVGDAINAYGGQAQGIGVYPGGNGGYIIAGIDLFAGSGGISTIGGRASTSGTGNSYGGNGGDITVDGNINCVGSISTSGGNGYDTAQGGTSGNITVINNIYAYILYLSGSISGPNSALAARNGGNIKCRTIFGIIMTIGGYHSSGTGTGAGGNGGSLITTGDFIGSINGYGGIAGSNGGNNGNGSLIYCGNNARARIDVRGPSGKVKGGNGGAVTINGNFIADGLIINGGDGVAGIGAATGGNGGCLIVKGDCHSSDTADTPTWKLNGGNSIGAAQGGFSGSISVRGNLIIPRVTVHCKGGNSTGAFPGRSGGGLGIHGSLVAKQIYISGGNAIAGQTNGAVGQLKIYNGGTIHYLEGLDGTGGNLPTTTNSGLAFCGYLCVGTINLKNRAGVEIAIAPASITDLFINPAALKCGVFTDLKKLTKGLWGSDQTGEVPSPYTDFYTFDGNLTWVYHTGSAF